MLAPSPDQRSRFFLIFSFRIKVPVSIRKLNRTRCFECLDSSIVIPVSRVCDEFVDCPDLSDECLCEGKVPKICDRVRLKGNKEQERNKNIR